MKHFIVLTLLFTSLWASAQITITSDIYPQIGDTLRVKNTADVAPEDTVTAAGPDQTWDYGMLDDGPVTETAIISVEDSGTEVEGSVSATGLPTGGFKYYGETEDHFGVLALNQAVPLPGLDLVFARYMEPLADYHAELIYEDDFTNSTSLVSSSIPGDIIPSEILDSLGLPFSPDSLRLEQDYVRVSTADAWGQLTTCPLYTSPSPRD